MELLITAGISFLLGIAIIGIIVRMVIKQSESMLDKVLGQNATCIRAVEQTNRAMQASLIAYHTENPSVSAAASKTLAEHMVRITEQMPVTEEPEHRNGVTLRAGIE